MVDVGQLQSGSVAAATPQFLVVLNWFEEVKQRALGR
jgi:hypothetical protein